MALCIVLYYVDSVVLYFQKASYSVRQEQILELFDELRLALFSYDEVTLTELSLNHSSVTQ